MPRNSCRCCTHGLSPLGPIPEISWNVPDHMIAHLRWGTPMPPGPDLLSAHERQARAVDILETVVSANSDATCIPVTPALCTRAVRPTMPQQPGIGMTTTCRPTAMFGLPPPLAPAISIHGDSSVQAPF